MPLGLRRFPMNGNAQIPDIHLNTPSKNVNLQKAREILGDRQLTEEQMVEKAGEIIDRVGVKVTVRAVVQQKFTDLLEKEGYSVRRTGIVTGTAQSSSGTTDNNPVNPGGNSGTGGSGSGGSDSSSSSSSGGGGGNGPGGDAD